jgi:hypothetical protein
MDESMDVIEALGWMVTGAIVLALCWAAHHRGRIHCLWRQRAPDALVTAVHELWRARLALVVALEA